MKVRAVKSIPEIQYRSGEKNDIMKLLDKFSKSKAKYWEVIYTEGEYASVHNLCQSLRDGIVGVSINEIRRSNNEDKAFDRICDQSRKDD